MAISDEQLARARAYDSRAAEAIVAASFPAAVRMARGLTGQVDVARRVARRVVQQSLQVMPRWGKGFIPEHWFYHHTLLTARQARQQFGGPPDPQTDLLVPPADPRDMGYVAFIRALRQLPPQQLEAMVLNHGERLNDRLLGVAMDCSAGAAANHLNAATDALSLVAGDQLSSHLATLGKTYIALTPAEPQVRAEIGQEVKSVFGARRLRRLVRLTLLLVLVGFAAYAAWRWRAQLAELPQHIQQLWQSGQSRGGSP